MNHVLTDQVRIPREQQDLLGVRTDTPYTEGERRYSAAVQAALEELLQGKRHEIRLLRRYHESPPRIAVLPASRGIDRSDLRQAMLERILIATLTFIRAAAPGGCVYQAVN